MFNSRCGIASVAPREFSREIQVAPRVRPSASSSSTRLCLMTAIKSKKKKIIEALLDNKVARLLN